jgi:hypothetical protein
VLARHHVHLGGKREKRIDCLCFGRAGTVRVEDCSRPAAGGHPKVALTCFRKWPTAH